MPRSVAECHFSLGATVPLPTGGDFLIAVSMVYLGPAF